MEFGVQLVLEDAAAGRLEWQPDRKGSRIELLPGS
jgi:hypothetical protein